MKIIAIIPARGGSKSIPNKNIKKLNKIFSIPVGLSDHSNSVYTSFGAVAH
jgi:CMP-N-acetylneuraminic acid synthetase|tara:strand:+ start:226 stop:378 length:153 start_codon:yes stop_codon:yes gene_type:complete